MTKHFPDLHRVDELKNFAANNIFRLVFLKSRTGICATVSHVLRSRASEKGNCHYRTSPIGNWGKGSIVGW